MYTVSLAQLDAIFTSSNETLTKYVEPLNKTFDRFKFEGPMEVRCFLAQVGHESGQFTTIVENLNYSEQGLLKVFKKYFDATRAKAYARQPRLIANRVYANRMGNGDEKSGDGWKYRGKGLIQITGHDNHANFAKFMEMSMDDICAYMLTPEGAAMSAGWFFQSNNLMPLAKAGKMTELTKRINGGLNGISERLSLFHKAEGVIK